MASDVSREFEYSEEPKQSTNWQLLRDIGETIVLTLLMFLVIRLAVQDFQVDGYSMVPTLQNTQFVLVDKLSYFFSSPQRGDVIVFEFPGNHSENYVKRVIGIPGDRVDISAAGQVSVNGIPIQEPYVNDLDNAYYGPESRILGPNEYWVLGDNRGASSDSRQWGVVHRYEIIGKASLVYWPISSFHFLPDDHYVFAHVGSGSSASSPSGNAPPASGDPVSGTFIFVIPVMVGVGMRSRYLLSIRRVWSKRED
jgi:signal peptidase I